MKLTKRVCTLEKVRFVYYTAGRGKTIFIAPPFHSDITRIAPLIELLAQNHRVIFPELPGVANAESLPDSYQHTAQTYARLLTQMVRTLRIRDYTLFGLSLGAIIGLEMLIMGCERPRRFVTYGAPMGAADIHLPAEMQLLLRTFQVLSRKKRLAVWFCKACIVNPTVLRIVFGIKYLGQKGYRDIVANQVRLTANMSPRAWVELIGDIFSYDYPKENERFAIPALHIYNRHDNIMDVPAMTKRLAKIFPLSKIFLLEETLHAPPGTMDKEKIGKQMKPMVKFLET